MIRSRIPVVLTVLVLAGAAAAPGRAEPVAVGERAPLFTLMDTDGHPHNLAEAISEHDTVVLEWFNPDCPFVKKHHKTFHTMTATHAAYPDVEWIAVNSGAPGKQGHGKERNRDARKDYGMDYPVLLDEGGTVGRLYGAKTTPHMFVIHKGVVVYEGAIDDNPSPAGEVGKTNYVAQALAELAGGKEVSAAQTKSYGCSVKYGSKPAAVETP